MAPKAPKIRNYPKGARPYKDQNQTRPKTGALENIGQGLMRQVLPMQAIVETAMKLLKKSVKAHKEAPEEKEKSKLKSKL